MVSGTPPHQQQAKPAAEPSALDNLAELSALVHLLKKQYRQQVNITQQTALAEWQLSWRSIKLSLALTGAAAVLGIVLWASIIALAGYAVFAATASIAVTAGVLIVLQIILLLWCWRSAKYLQQHIGFGHTKQQLTEFFHTTPQPGDSNANSRPDPKTTPGS